MPRHVPNLPKELDLLNVYTSTVADRINAVPGFKTSAAFFSFLRANLVLPSSTLNSTTSTPLLDPSSSQTLPPLGPSSLATMTSNADDGDVLIHDPLEGIPSLITTCLTSEEDKVAALKLVADSVAQQRNAAARAIILHPLTIAAYILIMAIVNQYLYTARGEWGVVLTTGAGLTMAYLVGVRTITSGYLNMAEEFSWSFAKNEDGEEDTIIGSRYGEEIIGAIILRLERNGNGKKKSKSGKHGGKGIVRAWTVRLKYRGTGVGTELLEESVRITREKLGNSAEIGFAAEHANSKMILPEFFNGSFRKSEKRAAQGLEKVIENLDSKKKR